MIEWMIFGMVQGATVVLGLMAWWACACRVSAMHYSTHRLEAIAWHLAAAGMALSLIGIAVYRPGDILALFCAAWLWMSMWRSLPDWMDGPPVWTQKARPAPAGITQVG